MKEESNFQIRQLKDQLAKETINYYKLVGYGASIEECRECNGRIKEMEATLASRRNSTESDILTRHHKSSPVEYSINLV